MRLSLLFLMTLSIPSIAQEVTVKNHCHEDFDVVKNQGHPILFPVTVCESSPSDWRD